MEQGQRSIKSYMVYYASALQTWSCYFRRWMQRLRMTYADF